MNRLTSFVCSRGQHLLNNKKHAIMYVVFLALLPYTTWISVALVALVTLRKGALAGGWLLAYAMLAHLTLSLLSLHFNIALLNTILVYIPCFIAAKVLRSTVSLRAACCAFIIQVLVVVMIIQYFMPELMVAQYLYFQSVLKELKGDSAVFAIFGDDGQLNQIIYASYLLGLQALGVVTSAGVSLMMARKVQSDLYFPGESKREILAFRGEKIELLGLLIILAAAYQQNLLAMSLVPVFILYFLLAGLALSFYIFAKQKPLPVLIMLLVPLVFLPFIMLPLYVLFGSLDSVFNFRSYLISDAGKV